MKKVFENTGKEFSASYAAMDWCEANGISVGSMQRTDPRGLMRGNWSIAKWRNLTNEEKAQLDGVMTGDHRNGTVTVELYDE